MGRKMNNKVQGNIVLASMSFLVKSTARPMINSNKDIMLKVDHSISVVSNACNSILAG